MSTVFEVIRSRTVIRPVTVLTGNYVAAKILSSDTHNFAGFQVDYTKGDETSMEMKIEVSNDGGQTYAQQVTESVTGGTITVSLAERKFTASGSYAIIINPYKASQIKVSFKATGGTPTGTVGCSAVVSWV